MPIQEHVESDESVVIRSRKRPIRRSFRNGLTRTAVAMTAGSCATRATYAQDPLNCLQGLRLADSLAALEDAALSDPVWLSKAQMRRIK